MSTLYYIHDPMCSWCYGFSHTLHSLIERLPESTTFCRLLGGLAPDNDEPMSEDMAISIHRNWYRIEEKIPGVTFNHDFWTLCVPRRSTYMACRAVIAARQQGDQYDELMTQAIQKAYYQEARNPSDTSILIELAAELALDAETFERALSSEEIEMKFAEEIHRSADLGAGSYPCLRLQVKDAVWPIPVNYNDADEMLELIDTLIS